jgi:antitoxin component of MazEF toxin-antitoxin module
MRLEYSRRLQLINNCAFVSLPKAWAQAHKLERGDRMSVSLLEDGSLKISPLEAA